jgi:putative endonuclease
VNSSELGRKGEEEAAEYLCSNGWTILDRNFRFGRNEVDIVAAKGQVLAFVEVKCRKGSGFGHPLEAITRKKRLEIARVARGWLRERDSPPGMVVRFDAVGVLWREGGRWELVHVPDAWRLG